MLNHIAIHGRLVRNPDLRTTQSGVSVCNFTVAVERSYTTGEDRQSDFFDVIAWRGLADLISKYFTKGKEIVVYGEMQSRKWTDKDGNNRTSWEVIASGVDFCGNKNTANNAEQNNSADTKPSESYVPDVPDSDDDLPFMLP